LRRERLCRWQSCDCGICIWVLLCVGRWGQRCSHYAHARRCGESTMRHFLSALTPIGLAFGVVAFASRRVLVAFAGSAYPLTASLFSARIGAVALPAIARAADAQLPAAQSAGEQSVCVSTSVGPSDGFTLLPRQKARQEALIASCWSTRGKRSTPRSCAACRRPEAVSNNSPRAFPFAAKAGARIPRLKSRKNRPRRRRQRGTEVNEAKVNQNRRRRF